jgi:hypothetical protein
MRKLLKGTTYWNYWVFIQFFMFIEVATIVGVSGEMDYAIFKLLFIYKFFIFIITYLYCWHWVYKLKLLVFYLFWNHTDRWWRYIFDTAYIYITKYFNTKVLGKIEYNVKNSKKEKLKRKTKKNYFNNYNYNYINYTNKKFLLLIKINSFLRFFFYSFIYICI